MAAEPAKLFNDLMCDAKVWQFWRDRYNVVPYVPDYWDGMPDTVLRAWNQTRPEFGGKDCNSLAGILDTDACGSLVEALGIKPLYDMGNASSSTSAAVQLYKSSNCDVKICMYWQAKYGIVPRKSWGKMPQELRPSWDAPRPSANGRSCNELTALAL